MGTNIHPQDLDRAQSDQGAPIEPAANAQASAFMASDEFAPFVLNCLRQAARSARARQTERTEPK
jgi:hypothetical protein